MSPVLASSRAGNFVRSLLIIGLMVIIFRELYLLWFFHTPAWTSRPPEIRYCGSYYEQRENPPDVSTAEMNRLAGGRVKQIMRSPVLRPVAAYRPAKACPRYVFAKVDDDRFVVYTFPSK
ncbi:hypothetical protein [Pseudofrankia saprophytica]|uniref:hypothetical protein n=1 Tax=Pseudofrankia saprophytica TaxID=298655 RepID=UPI000234B252|nr:hypothetical protein [Pseudofrankia saprophytica]